MDYRRIKTVFSKEVLDNARDRKAWSIAALYVIIGPLLFLAVLSLAGRMLADESTRTIELPVVGAEHAPNLIQYLEQRNITPAPGPSDPEQAVRERHFAAVLVIPPSYPRDLASGRPATVQLFHDRSRNVASYQVGRVRDALDGYGAALGQLRLLARGIDPSLVHALAIESADLATPYSRAAFLFGSIPIFLLMSLFVGGLYIAIDTTAGERERGSLEPLLINPLTPAEIILGKLGAVIFYATLTVLLTIGGFGIVLNSARVDIPGVRLGLSAAGLLCLVAILLPATFLAAALQIRLASASRTFKEAQTAGQFLMLIPAIPGMLQLFGSIELSRYRHAPFFSQQLLIDRVLKGESLPLIDWGMGSLCAIGLGILLTLDTIRRYQRARVLFG
jgi:sodium transport system permease protein